MHNEANRSEGKQIYPEEHVLQLKTEAVPEDKDVGLEDEMEKAQIK